MKNSKLLTCMKLIFIGVMVALATGCTNNTNTVAEKDTAAKLEPVAIERPAKAMAQANRDAPPTDTASGAWLLVPGQSAGLTRLNENAEEVYQRLGPPDGGDAAMQKAVAIWYTGHDSTNHSVAIYTAREPGTDPVARIRQIRVTSPRFKTAEGVGPGNTVNDIRRKFKMHQIEQYNDAGITYKVYDSPQGIAFEANSNGRCVAVVVHDAGTTGERTYLKFRTTNKYISKRKD